mgnify:CR=1 FL=1
MATRRAKSSQKNAPQANPRIREAAAEIYRVVRPVTIDEIIVIDEVQVRESLDEEHVERLAALILSGGQYKDPIVLHEEDDGSRRILSDGWHRREGYRRAQERFVPSKDVPELEPLLAEIRPGGLTAAIEYAEEANLAHGKQLSVTGKKNVCFRRWTRGHEWVEWSNSMIAGALAIAERTVSAWRAEFEESTGAICASSRIGADGKMRDVSKIQASNQLRAARQALAKLDLPALVPGSTEHEAASELIRWLNTSLQDFKNKVPVGSRFRAYLPYALAKELDRAEPRISYVNWMRSELPKWQDEQRQAEERQTAAPPAPSPLDDKRRAIAAAVVEVLRTGGRPMTWREIEFAVNGNLGRIVYPNLLGEMIDQLRRDGQIRNVGGGRYALPDAAEAPGVNDLHLPADAPASDTGWLDTPASKGAPPQMATAATGDPAHSDDHDPDLDAAIRLEAQLSGALIRLSEAADAVLAIRDIRSLYALPEARMRSVSDALYLLSQLASDLEEYAQEQHEKLRIMARTGRPYDEEDEDHVRILP